MVRVMDGPYSGPFNIGNPTEFTMLELAQVVKEVVNPKAEITYKENTSDDPTRRKPDISKVRPSPNAQLCISLQTAHGQIRMESGICEACSWAAAPWLADTSGFVTAEW